MVNKFGVFLQFSKQLQKEKGVYFDEKQGVTKQNKNPVLLNEDI